MKKNVAYSIVIPVYNSEKSLKELFERLKSVLDNMDENYELIFVDDKSEDFSWKSLQEIYSINDNVKIIQLFRNVGQHNALMCGFNYSQGRYIITMDDDLQHPPEEVPKLISKINEGYLVVYGNYIKRKHHMNGIYRIIFSNLFNLIISKTTKINIKITSFRIIRSEVIGKIKEINTYGYMIDPLLLKIVPNNLIGVSYINHSVRKYGRTNYSFKKLAFLALNTLFSLNQIRHNRTLPSKDYGALISIAKT